LHICCILARLPAGEEFAGRRILCLCDCVCGCYTHTQGTDDCTEVRVRWVASKLVLKYECYGIRQATVRAGQDPVSLAEQRAAT